MPPPLPPSPTAPRPEPKPRGLPVVGLWLLTLAVGLVLAGSLAAYGYINMLSGWHEDEAVQAVLGDQRAAWNRGDLDGFMAGYWDDAGLRFFSGGTVTTGWQATLDRYRKRYQADGKEMGTLAFTEVEVESLGPNAALARGRWALTFTKSDDRPSGLFTLLLRKTPAGWKIVHDHTSAAEVPKKP